MDYSNIRWSVWTVAAGKEPQWQCSTVLHVCAVTCLLASWTCLLSESLPSSPSPSPTHLPLQTALRLGLGYPPLARAALDALDTWSTSLPPSLLQPYYSSLLPVLDDYLKAANDGKCWWWGVLVVVGSAGWWWGVLAGGGECWWWWGVLVVVGSAG